MERVIGVFGSLLRQPSNPFGNLASQAQKMANVNSLVAMWPSFDSEKKKDNPRGSIDIGDDYLLLGPREDSEVYNLSSIEEAALSYFFSDHPDVDCRSVWRWGRLKLPTEQIARSRWRELERCSGMSRTDRNVKVHNLDPTWISTDAHAQILFDQDSIRFGEVRFYFVKEIAGVPRAFALVSLYSSPDASLLQHTYDTLCVCRYRGDGFLAVVDVKSIISVVAMVPFPFHIRGCAEQYFLIEQFGLDVIETDIPLLGAV